MSWPVVTTAGASAANPAFPGTLSWSHVISSGQTLLEVFVGQGNNLGADYITGVTWNGAALTKKTPTITDGVWDHAAIWELINPTPATGNVVVSFSSAGQIAATSISFDGASTTTGAISVGTTNNTTNPTLTVVDSASGDTVISFWVTDDGTGATTTANATEFFDIEDLGADIDLNAQYQTAVGGNTVCGWTHTQAGGGPGVLIGVAIKQAAGGVGAASSHTDTGQTRNRPGRGPHSLGKFFRPRIDAFTSLIGPIAATASDTNTPTDSALADVSKVAVAADTNTPTDSALADVTKVAVAADTNTPTDSALADTTKVAVAADTNTPTDSALADTSKVASATDTNTPTDSAAALRVAGVAFGEDTNVPTDSAVAIRVTPPVTGGGHAWLRTYLQELYQREFAAAAALRKEAEEARLAALGPKPTLQRSKRTPKVAGRAAPRPAASESSKSPRVVFPTVPKLQPSLDEHLRGVTALPAPIKLTVRPKTIGLPQGVGELDADDVEALLAFAKAFNL